MASNLAPLLAAINATVGTGPGKVSGPRFGTPFIGPASRGSSFLKGFNKARTTGVLPQHLQPFNSTDVLNAFAGNLGNPPVVPPPPPPLPPRVDPAQRFQDQLFGRDFRPRLNRAFRRGIPGVESVVGQGPGLPPRINLTPTPPPPRTDPAQRLQDQLFGPDFRQRLAGAFRRGIPGVESVGPGGAINLTPPPVVQQTDPAQRFQDQLFGRNFRPRLAGAFRRGIPGVESVGPGGAINLAPTRTSTGFGNQDKLRKAFLGGLAPIPLGQSGAIGSDFGF
jgi:hypothetical protein